MEYYFPNEVLENILIRLPYKPLFRSKLVSKQWNSIVSDLRFARLYMLRATSGHQSLSSSHLLAFFHSHVNGKDDVQPPKSSDKNPPSLYVSSLSSQPKCCYDVQILSSSRGLLLSRIHPNLPSASRSEVRLCVSNPLTRHFARIPPLPCPKSLWTVALSTRLSSGDSAYVAYKVVYFRRKNESTVIETFCSETGQWSIRELEQVPAPEELFYCPEIKVVCRNGILHFLMQETMTIVTYDPYNSPDRFGYIDIDLPSPDPDSFEFVCAADFRSHSCEDDLPIYTFVEHCNDRDSRVSECRLLGYDNGGEWRYVSNYLVGKRREYECSSLIRIELCPWSSPLYYKSPRAYSCSLSPRLCMKIRAYYKKFSPVIRRNDRTVQLTTNS